MKPANALDLELLGPFDRLVVGMNAVGSLWILFLVLLVTGDAMSRSFLHAPFAGVTELIQISIIAIVFLQLADAIRTRRLTRADSFLTLLRARRPKLGFIFEGSFYLLGAIYMGLGLWGSVPLLVEAYQSQEVVGNSGLFTLIVWPIKAVIVLGLSASLAEFLRQALGAWSRVFNT